MTRPTHVYLRPTVSDPSDSLLDDCRIVTGLLQRALATRPGDAPSVVLASVREQCRRVFQIDWRHMELVVERDDDQSSGRSADRLLE